MSPVQHLKAAASFTVISLNLLFWTVPLVGLSIAKFFSRSEQSWIQNSLNRIYRAAVHIDDFWLKGVIGVRWQDPSLELDRGRNYVVLANHRSWSDIFVVQSVISKSGPIVKFLCKRELAYIPVLGLIFWAFDFPMLNRRARRAQSSGDRKLDNRRRVVNASRVLLNSPAAILTFAEGTRFTTKKHKRSKSRYTALLAPHAGGLRAILEGLKDDDVKVVDLTLIYPESSSFWRFLSGDSERIDVHADIVEPPKVSEDKLAAWLHERWRIKDRLLAPLPASSSVDRLHVV